MLFCCIIGKEIMRIKKFFAKVFVIIAAIFLVSSTVVLAAEADHDCSHEDCQICEVIRTAKETIKQTKIASPVSGVIFLLPLLFAFIFSIAFISLSFLQPFPPQLFLFLQSQQLSEAHQYQWGGEGLGLRNFCFI